MIILQPTNLLNNQITLDLSINGQSFANTLKKIDAYHDIVLAIGNTHHTLLNTFNYHVQCFLQFLAR